MYGGTEGESTGLTGKRTLAMSCSARAHQSGWAVAGDTSTAKTSKEYDVNRQLTNTQIKEAVQRGYTQAVQGGGGCCAPSAVVTLEQKKAKLTHVLGYAPEELEKLPEAAVASAFGCGNPLAFSGVQPGDVVLDIGSGAGIDCLLAAQKVGSAGRVIGLDMTPAMLAKARENEIGRAHV